MTGIFIRTTAAADPYDSDAACTTYPNQSGLNWDVQGQWRSNPPQPFARDAVVQRHPLLRDGLHARSVLLRDELGFAVRAGDHDRDGSLDRGPDPAELP